MLNRENEIDFSPIFASWKELAVQKNRKANYPLLKNISNIRQFHESLSGISANKFFPDIIFINQLIIKFAELGLLGEAYQLLELAIIKNIADIITFSSVLKIIAEDKNPDVNKAEAVLKKAIEHECVDINIYNAFLKILANVNYPAYADLKKAFPIFNKIKSDDNVTESTFSYMLTIIAKTRNPDINLGLDILRKGLKKFPRSSVLYNDVLHIIASSPSPDIHLALSIFNPIKESIIDSYIWTTMLDIISKSVAPDVSLAFSLLTDAENKNCNEVSVYNAMINVIARSHDPKFDKALEVLKRMSSGLPNRRTYNSIIHVIAKSKTPDFAEALMMFKEAKLKVGVDDFSYNNLLAVIAKSKTPDFEQALALFAEMRNPSKITYHTLLDILINSPEPYSTTITDTITECLLAIKNYTKIRVKENKTYIDLHEFSFGSACFYLKAELGKLIPQSADKETKVVLIYGKSDHPFSHPIKSAVKRVQKEMDLCGEEDHENAGRFNLTLKMPIVIEKKKVWGANTISTLFKDQTPTSNLSNIELSNANRTKTCGGGTGAS